MNEIYERCLKDGDFHNFYERYLKDEDFRAAIAAAARRERVEAIRRFIIEPLKALVRRPEALPKRRATRMLHRWV